MHKLWKKLRNKFGEPIITTIDDVFGVSWNPKNNKIFKRITLLDQPDNLLLISIFIKLFAGHTNVEITSKAVHNKLSQMFNLSSKINYDMFSKSVSFKSCKAV